LKEAGYDLERIGGKVPTSPDDKITKGIDGIYINNSYLKNGRAPSSAQLSEMLTNSGAVPPYVMNWQCLLKKGYLKQDTRYLLMSLLKKE